MHEIFARTFPGQPLDDEASFVDLGGDSLTYVQVSADLERALGHLPDGWDGIGLGELARQAAPATTPSRWARLEAAIVLRALAIVLVVGEHDHLWTWLGGAHLLLAVAGWTFSRFVLTRDDEARDTVPGHPRLPLHILRSAALIAVPSSLWILLRATMTGSVHYADALLLGSVFHPLVQGYWFVDSLVQILVVVAVLFAVPAVRRVERRHRFGLPAVVLAASLTMRLVPGYDDTVTPDLYSTHLVLWLFVLGWLLHRATTPRQRAISVAATLVLVPSFFGTEYERAAIVLGGLLVLLLVDRVRVPRLLVAPITAIAGASLGIYLTHFALLPLFDAGVPAVVLVGLGLVVGIAAWRLGSAVAQRAVRHVRDRRAVPGARQKSVSGVPRSWVSAPRSTSAARATSRTPMPNGFDSTRSLGRNRPGWVPATTSAIEASTARPPEWSGAWRWPCGPVISPRRQSRPRIRRSSAATRSQSSTTTDSTPATTSGSTSSSETWAISAPGASQANGM